MLNNFTGKKKVEMGRDRERKGGGGGEKKMKKKNVASLFVFFNVCVIQTIGYIRTVKDGSSNCSAVPFVCSVIIILC